MHALNFVKKFGDTWVIAGLTKSEENNDLNTFLFDGLELREMGEESLISAQGIGASLCFKFTVHGDALYGVDHNMNVIKISYE